MAPIWKHYNPALPPRCECGGNTKELKRKGDEWVWLKCMKCGAHIAIIDSAVKRPKDEWEQESQNTNNPFESQTKQDGPRSTCSQAMESLKDSLNAESANTGYQMALQLNTDATTSA